MQNRVSSRMTSFWAKGYTSDSPDEALARELVNLGPLVDFKNGTHYIPNFACSSRILSPASVDRFPRLGNAGA